MPSSVADSKFDEWLAIREQLEDVRADQTTFRRARAWLQKNESEPCAGAAIAVLLEKKPTKGVIAISNRWLKRFPSGESAPEVVGQLMRVAPSPQVTRLAIKCVRASSSAIGLATIIDETLQHSNSKSLFNALEALFERRGSTFYLPKYRAMNKVHRPLVCDLMANWFRREKKNSSFWLSIALLCEPDYSRSVIDAAFEWIKEGGRHESHFPRMLANVLRCAHRKNSPKVVPITRYARQWIKRNSNHPDTGLLHGAIIYTANSKTDRKAAWTWYQEFAQTEHAPQVLSALIGTCDRSDPNAEVLAEEGLRRCELDFASLGYYRCELATALVRTRCDAITKQLLVQAYNETGVDALIPELLIYAPDERIRSIACAIWGRWIDSPIEPRMLYGLLKVDRSNERVRRRAKHFLSKNPKHRYATALKSLLQSQRKQLAPGRNVS